ncbi:hypothetical protein HY439_01345 [Candidatus Microgenomates bacterium]|nr:hypothetical protein [Candidatus Microgenomates bacterium]
MRQWFAQKKTTFNRIHTGYFLNEIVQNKHLFPPDLYQELKQELSLYEKLWEKREEIHKNDKPDIGPAARALGETAKDLLTERAIFKLIADPEYRANKLADFISILTDPKYRAFLLQKNIILRGVERARQEGIIADDEWSAVWEAMEIARAPERKTRFDPKATLTSLQIYYLVSGQILNILEGSAYIKAVLDEDKFKAVALGIFVGRILPSIIRPVSTLITGAVSKNDLRVATVFSAFPGGTWAAIPIQFGAMAAGRNRLVLHYAIRDIIAGLSKLSPSGGWGTELEAKLYEKVGARLEKIAQPKD